MKKRMELLEKKIEQLEIYLDGKCPENKKKCVRQLLKFYCKQLCL